MKRSILASLSMLVISTLSWGQQPLPCGTDLMRARMIAEDPTYLDREAAFLQELEDLIHSSAVQRDDDQVYRIPVVFHILHLRGRENITNEQILNQMDILNRDYAKMNQDTNQVHPSFEGNIARMDIQFRLATKDPQGHCTNGIIRHQTVETFRGESTSKLQPWPRSKYMNIWVTDQIESGAAGYFTYGPWAVLDGIMIRHEYVGNIPTSNENTSRALTHEVGHYLSLAHVWGGNNGVPDENTPQWAMQSACGDDGVEDTPYTRGWNDCPASNNSPRPWGDCDQQSFKTYHGRTNPTIPAIPVIYTFDDVSTGSGTTDPSIIPNVTDSIDSTAVRLPLSPFTAVGVSSNPVGNDQFAFSNWGIGANDGETDYANLTDSFDAGNYYQFTIQTPVTQQLYFNSMGFAVSRNTSGARTFSVRSSVNNYNTNLPMTAQTGVTVQTNNIGFFDTDDASSVLVIIDPPAAGYSIVEGPITFRIYAWNAEDGTGSFGVDDVNLLGKSGTIENVENYMEYSYCSYMFTNGQRTRARAALNSPTYQRDLLWTENNLQITGTADGSEVYCAPEADFYAQVGTDPTNPAIPFPGMACTNATVRFVDNSSKAFPESWAWTFQDGNPATSTQRNPTVQFTAPGWKSVTLTVTNAQGSSTKTDPYGVYIGNPDVAVTPYYESFETMEVGTNLYPFFVQNYERNFTAFDVFTGGGATGNKSAKLNSGDRDFFDFIDQDNAGDYDDLITPLFNLTGAPSATLSFRYAYSTNTTVPDSIDEYLEVTSSTDCGRTWLLRGNITGTTLVNNGNNHAEPPGVWTLKSYTLPNSLLTQNVRFRFRFVSSVYSGDLFIDDIWIGVPVGMEELMGEGFITLFPNPTNDHFNIQVIGMESSATDITITDMRGAVVFQNKYQPKGGANIDINGRAIGLSEGMYMVRASNNVGSSVQKLIMGR